jgi:DNA-binding NtrC family response regulator
VPEEPAIAFEPGMTMAELEKEAIIATLRDVGGNRRKAAERLQIGERTLYRKLKEYDIEL